MKIKECAYLSNEDLLGNLSDGTCNLFNNKLCEQIPISKCPYKMFCLGKITKEELNEKIKTLLNKNFNL